MGASGHAQINVLVVDDDPGIRELLVEVVSRMGHQAVPAGSAEEILKLLPYWRFDAAFIDHHLPGMEGLVLGEYLVRSTESLRVVIVTGAKEENLDERCAALGMGLLRKPFRVSTIEDVLDEVTRAVIESDGDRPSQGPENFAPRLSGFADELTGRFDIPSAPNRIEARLVDITKRSLNNLRSEHRFTEEDRVTAFSGLVTARVLGFKLPKAPSGKTLYEEYDAIMEEHGLRTEFDE